MDSIINDSSLFFEEDNLSNVPDSDNNIESSFLFSSDTSSTNGRLNNNLKDSLINQSSNSSNGGEHITPMNMSMTPGYDSTPLSCSSSSISALHAAENEVFVGGIARNLTDEELNDLFSTVGVVNQVRIMKDKTTGETKGYGFVSFRDKSCCKEAVEQMNNKEFKGKTLRVKFSENKRKIFMGNLPKELTKDQLLKILHDHSEGITMVDFLTDPDNSTRNRGFVFIEYSDYYLAEKARKDFSQPSFKIGNCNVTVNWADPVQEPDQSVMDQVKVLYIRNLPENRSEQGMRELFQEFGVVDKIIIPSDLPGQQQRRDFGFVHFDSRDAAEATIKRHRKTPVVYGGRTLTISFAKPIDKRQRAELRIRRLQRSVTRQQHTMVGQSAVAAAHHLMMPHLVPTPAGMNMNIAMPPNAMQFLSVVPTSTNHHHLAGHYNPVTSASINPHHPYFASTNPLNTIYSTAPPPSVDPSSSSSYLNRLYQPTNHHSYLQRYKPY